MYWWGMGVINLGLQVYTDNKKPKQLIKLIADNEQQILDYVEELKKCGYDIVDFPPIEYFRRTYQVNMKVTQCRATE